MFKRHYLWAVLVATIVIGIIGIVAYIDWREYELAANRQAAIVASIDIVRELMALVVEAEAEERRYILAGDDRHLTRYRAVIANIQAQLTSVSTEASRPDAISKELRDLISRTLEDFKAEVASRAAGEVRAEAISDRREERMEQLRSTAAQLVVSLQADRNVTTRRFVDMRSARVC